MVCAMFHVVVLFDLHTQGPFLTLILFFLFTFFWNEGGNYCQKVVLS